MTAPHDSDGGQTGDHAAEIAKERQRRRTRIAVFLGVVLAIGLLPFLYPRVAHASSTTQVAFSVEPGDGSPGTVLAASPTVQLEDGSNNVVTSDSSTVSLTLTDASGNALTGLLPTLTPNARDGHPRRRSACFHAV